MFPLLILSTFVFLEMASFSRLKEPLEFRDTSVFLKQSRVEITTPAFFTGGRPFFAPLVFKALHEDKWAIFAAQSIFSVAAWFLFGWIVTREIKTPILRCGLLASICLFSLSIPVNQWDAVVLSESLSLSMTMTAFGFSLMLVQRIRRGYAPPWDWGLLSIWALSCFLLCGTRDINIYVIWLLLMGFGFWGAAALALARIRKQSVRALMGTHRMLPAAVAVLLLIGLFGDWSVNTSLRWRTPLINVMLGRVLASEAAYRQFVSAYQLPDNPELKKLAKKKAWERYKKKKPIRKAMMNPRSKLHNVHQWLETKGISAYTHYLLWDNLLGSVKDVVNALSTRINASNIEYNNGTAGITPWTRLLSGVTYPRLAAPIPMFVITFVWSLFSFLLGKDRSLLPVTVIGSLIATWIHAFVGYHGDTADLSRHMFASGILFRLALLVFVVLAVQDLVRMGQRSQGGGEEIL